MSLASLKQMGTRGKRGKPADLEEIEAIADGLDLLAERVERRARERWERDIVSKGFRDENGQIQWTVELIRTMAEKALITLYDLAATGDRVAAIFLAQTFLGQPDLPYEEKVKRMDESQLKSQLEEILGKKLTNETIDGLILAFLDPAPPQLSGGEE
jgi:hypothetical protein